GMLVNIGSRFVPDPGTPMTAPTCGARDAVAAACDEVGDTRIMDIVGLIAPETDCTSDWTIAHHYEGVGETGLSVRAVLFVEGPGAILQAWSVRLPNDPSREDAATHCIVRHSDGAVLESSDTTSRMCQPEPATFAVYPYHSPVPAWPALETHPANPQEDTECKMRSQLGRIGIPSCDYPLGDGRANTVVTWEEIAGASPNGWLNDAAYSRCADPPATGVVSQTCGNNFRVYAIANLVAQSPTQGVGRVFAAPFAIDSDPPTAPGYMAASVTQAFYTANRWHDALYALGFDEAAGNFQEANFGAGGVEGDSIDIRVNGGAANEYGRYAFAANENWSEDGGDSAVTLSIMTHDPASPRSAALDSQVLFHELTHAMTNRLHVAAVRVGPFVGMHEGWADFFAACLTTPPDAMPGDGFPMFCWPARMSGSGGSANVHRLQYYFGARRYPYSTNMAGVNPLTFGFLDPGVSPDGPPNPYPDAQIPRNRAVSNSELRSDFYLVGTVWATVLLECRAALATAPSPLDMTSATEVAMQLVVDGMKLDPTQVDFIRARDAILQADLIRYGGVHQTTLWKAFAKRGLGLGAAYGPGGSPRGLDESIGTPGPDVSVFFPDDVPAIVETCRPTTIEAVIVAPGEPLSSVNLHIMNQYGDELLTTALQPDAEQPGLYRAVLVPAVCKDPWDIFVRCTFIPGANADPIDTALYRVVGGGRGAAQAVLVNGRAIEHMEGESSPWTVDPPVGAPGAWERVDPNGGIIHPARDTTTLGTHCWVTQAHPITSNYDPNLDDVDVGPPDGVTLTSPPVPGILDQKTVVVEFSIWYANLGATDTDDEVHVLWDMGVEGMALVGKLHPKNSRLVWQRFRGSVGTGSAAAAPRLVIRAIDQGAPSSLEVAIDDVRIRQVVDCEECCDGDINQDGNVDQDDTSYLIQIVAGGQNPVGTDPDFNRDGNVDQDDVLSYINYAGGAGCP
ncbi:MAG: M36 family metallopeptidase, partial [Phycisphaerales bacterium]|nr:M36 family metallopeptidase [Phycisphaerales bacterium]